MIDREEGNDFMELEFADHTAVDDDQLIHGGHTEDIMDAPEYDFIGTGDDYNHGKYYLIDSGMDSSCNYITTMEC